MRGLTSEFGMGSGVSPALWTPQNVPLFRTDISNIPYHQSFHSFDKAENLVIVGPITNRFVKSSPAYLVLLVHFATNS